ncbi:MAG: YbaN family protein [Acidimicrobiia bacterium]|nr:YbaN family protein [Acidimicrobiia bacterium]
MAVSVESTVSGKPRSLLLRGIYLILGLICLGFAAISFIPGIPTFDFVILAAFFFARSSETLHNWLLNHKYFGRVVNAYQDGLSLGMKWWAAVAITLSLGASIVFLISSSVLRTILAVVWIYAVWFVFSRPTRQTP